MKLSSLKQQIEELDAKATGGPWVVLGDLSGIWQDDVDEGICSFDSSDINIKHNSDFIALSRTALPELLRRLLVAEEALDRIKRPVWWMQEDQRRKTGSINGVSGAQAVALASDPNYLRDIASKALKTIRGEEE